MIEAVKMEEFSIVSNEKAKSDSWIHFGLRKRKSNGQKSVKTDIKTAGGTSNMNTHLKRHHPQLLSKCTSHTAAKSTPSKKQ